MLHTNDDFLNAIAAEPGERTLRLVYADWLDEHDDPRGELVRVEEEMRLLPVFADRFWELKPRRNALRAQIGAEWCGRMRYGTECEPVFRHGIPDGWRDRWRLIREFTERWHGVPMPDVGGRKKEIAEAEARLGRTLPPSVREWVAFAHDMDRRYGPWLHVIRDRYELENLSDQPALSLLCQFEGDFLWAVEHAALGRADPPVCGYGVQFGDPETHDPDDERYPRAERLTEFALNYCITYTHGDSGDGADTTFDDPAPILRELATMFSPPVQFGCRAFCETENILVYTEPCTWRSGTRFRMTVFKPLPREQMPALLWQHSSNGGVFHGRFTRQPERQETPVSPNESDIPPTGPDAPVPF